MFVRNSTNFFGKVNLYKTAVSGGKVLGNLSKIEEIDKIILTYVCRCDIIKEYC